MSTNTIIARGGVEFVPPISLAFWRWFTVFIILFPIFYKEIFDKKKEFKKNRLINHVILLKELDSTKYAKDILKHLALLNIDQGSEVLAAKLSTEVERYDFAIQISKQASYEKRFYNKFNYPIINTPKEINNKIMPNPEIILECKLDKLSL